ncbi:BCCT family transporter [Pontibacillus marinus]|uniref:BCCT family Osmoprotectant transporter n=1 Tax=Pontibacillus marinus BH030004 = DSM 16465 TaxID=1385511 RepID=A0A0A5GIA5_9BACI|nr:BCCT family transporter [Pontibacillus marinus]KGX91749.1 BCCT family Osmoprotectant transporter [Pontibacillus marinus BH030004 = DSM 16465]
MSAEPERNSNTELQQNVDKNTRKGVFIPAFFIVGGGALLGIVNNELLAEISKNGFHGSLQGLGWLYQIISIVALILVGIVTFSKLGNIRLGGADAKPKHPFRSWFAMALTGGIATGVITYGVNEPIIYFGNIYGEMAKTGVEPGTNMAAIFAMGRSLYNWSFIPYAMYSLSGLVIAYVYFNRKQNLSVSGSLTPLFGKKITKGIWPAIIDTLAVLAIALGLASSLGAGLALIGSGIEATYGIPQGPMVWLFVAFLITGIFTLSALKGLDKGIRRVATLNANVFYVLLVVLLIIGPTLYILQSSTAGLGYWFQNFWEWGLDPGIIGGEALVTWWTLYDWAIWIAYAPLMGIFLAVISYGRTIRQFMLINWILPAFFSVLWFGIFGGTALHWQQNGVVDLVSIIKENGAVAGLWTFLANMPLAAIIIPVVMIALILSFATAADSMVRAIAMLSTKKIRYDEEPAKWKMLIWAFSIAIIAYIMVAFAGGAQGVDGVKYLAALGGSSVLFVFVLQVASAIKMFFVDKIEE